MRSRIQVRDRIVMILCVVSHVKKHPDIFLKTSRRFFKNVLMFFQKRLDVFVELS
jgi:hypothetical protein